MTRLLIPAGLFLVAAACSTAHPEEAYALDVEGMAGFPAVHGPAQVEEWEERFESEGREIYEKRYDVLEAARVRRGMSVVDVGAGTGLFTLPLAELVGPEGRVYAVDIVQNFVDLIRDRARHARMDNVDARLCTTHSILLPPESADLAFLCDVYRYFDHPRDSMASIRTALRPGGQLVLIDFVTLPAVSTEWAPDQALRAKEAFIREIESYGFQLEEDLPVLEESFFLRFSRTGGPAGPPPSGTARPGPIRGAR